MPSPFTASASSPASVYARRGPRWRIALLLLLGQLAMVLQVAVLALVYRNLVFDISIGQVVQALLVTVAISAIVQRLNAWLDKVFSWRRGLLGRFVLQLSLDVAAAVGLLIALQMFFWLTLYIDNTFGGFLSLEYVLIYATVVVLISTLYVLTEMGLYLLQQWRATTVEAEQARKQNLEYRFETLRNQVNPHFLFNSLNTLASLVHEDADTAGRFVRQMSKVYRYVLENRERDVLPLSEELAFLQAYLYLIEIRFGQAVQVDISVPEGLQDALLPPISLQLLVENAIKHNIASRMQPLFISIAAMDGPEGPIVAVTNNLQLKSTPEPSTRTGLANIRSRYEFITARQMEVAPSPAEFTVRLPLLEPDVHSVLSSR